MNDYDGAFIRRPNGSVLYFDITSEEVHGGSSEVTKFPVEDGPNISDHVRPEQTPLTIRVFISNTPLVPSGNGAVGDSTQSSVLIDLKKYPQPPGTVAAQVLLNPVGSVISAVSGLGAPESVALPVLMFPQDFDAPTDAIDVLEEIRLASELLTIYTSVGEYESMVLEKYTLVRNAQTGTGAEADITFAPLRIVTSKSVPAPNMTIVKQDARTKKGPQGPEPAQPPKASLSKAGLNSGGVTNAGSGVVQ